MRHSTSKMLSPWKRFRDPSRSLEMSPFNRLHMISYWRSAVTLALSRVVSEIFTVEKYHNLEVPVKGQSRSLKVVPFDRLGMVFLLVFYSNIVPKMHISEILKLQGCKYTVTFKPGLGDTQGHQNRHRLICHLWLNMNVP